MDKKRRCLDLATKYEIIKACEDSNVAKSRIGRQYGLTPSTLFTILKNKDKITDAVLQSNPSRDIKRLRSATHHDLEAALFEWFCLQEASNVPINGPMIRAKANELALEMNIDNFKCSSGWLSRFKLRKGITLNKISWELDDVNEEIIVDDWVPILMELVKRYKARNVYNASECMMYYNLLPDETLKLKNDSNDVDVPKADRLTLLLCSNMDGSDKRKPFIVGKSGHPLVFQGASYIQCTYATNSNALMSSELFNQWLVSFNAEIASENRKIVLLVDRSSAHSELQLRNIKLIFLPTNSMSISQPFCQGVFDFLKHKYRSILVNTTLRHLSVSGSVTFKWNMLDAIRSLTVLWEELPPEYIATCFRRAGFLLNGVTKDSKDDETDQMAEPEGWCPVAQLLNLTYSYKDYVTFDDRIPMCVPLGDVECTEPVKHEVDASLEEQFDEDMYAVPAQSSLMQALHVINQLYRSTNTTTADLKTYYELERYVMENGSKN